MNDIAKLQTNMSSGELDPTMRGRIDTGAYANGVKQGRNVALLNTGGGTRRPGTRRVVQIGATATRILPFDYDESSRFIIGLQPGSLIVYTLSGSIVTTLSGPWLAAEIRQITYTQLGDTLFLAHKNWMTRVIKRVTDTNWTLSTFSFEATALGDKVFQPYENFTPIGTYVVPSADTGSITLSASASIFQSGHVGTHWRFGDVEAVITAVASGTSATATCLAPLRGKLIANAMKAKQGTTTIEVAHPAHGLNTGDSITIIDCGTITTSQPANTGGTTQTAIITEANLNGAHTVTVIDGDTYTFAQGGAPVNALSTTDGGGAAIKYSLAGHRCYAFLEQVFSAVRGYPRAVCFHEQRLWFGGSTSRPDGLWSSWIYRYFNFDVGDGSDNMSIQVTIGSDLGSAVKHIASNRHLQVFTGSKEFFCPPPTNTTLTPGTFRIIAQSAFGCGDVRPQVLDGATLYLQANQKTIREYMYDYMSQGYNATAISLLSAHLIVSPVDCAVLRGTASRGEQYAFFIRSDGKLAVFISSRADKMAGWTPWDTRDGDSFYSACNVGNTLYFVVLRNGVYHLELLEADDSVTLDFSVTLTSGSPTSVFTSTAHANQTVKVVSGGQSYGTYVVGADGTINIAPLTATSINVGFDYTLTIETMSPSYAGPRGERHGSITRIIEALILFDGTYNCVTQGQRLTLRQVTDDVALAPNAATSYFRWRMLGYSRQPTVLITQDEPLPLRILAIKTKVIV